MRRLLLGFGLMSSTWGAALPHALQDLSGEEINRTVEIIRASKRFPDTSRFPILALEEPDKAMVLAGKPVPRRARASVLAPKEQKFWEATVDLTTGKLEKVVEQKGQAPILLEEYDINADIVRKDLGFIKAIEKRGIKIEDVALDSWVPGILSAKERKSGARLMRAVAYLKGKSINFFARPIEGIIATVDMSTKKVIELIDTGVEPVAAGTQELSEPTTGVRPPLKPLSLVLPDGVSFSLKDGEVSWDNWRFRFSIHPQKGLTVYQVAFVDKGQRRSVAYKLGLSEMVVPYGDPDKTWAFRNAFDLGEYGVGRTAHTLLPGIDAPESARFFDAEFADDGGKVFTIPRAVALYERETGILWKHQDQSNRDLVDARMGRELVLSFMTVVANYDYGFSYIFKLDGTVEVEAQLTGILQAKGTKLTKNPCVDGCSHLVEPNIIAPSHQHFFAFRLDLDVDGTKNLPVEMNTKAIESTALNPFHNAFDVVNTTFKTEKGAGRDLNLASSRKWKLMSSTAKNALEHPTGYALIPGENSVPYLKPQSQVRQRAGFINHHVWFTRYRTDEQGAAGEYPNQAADGEGLPKYIADNEKLENEDVVLWYTFGITHISRPEDWPIMSVHRAGFKLIPLNFFSRNPSMDVPAPARKAAR